MTHTPAPPPPASAAPPRVEVRRLGVVAALFYAVHAAELLARFPPQNLLWSCNLASLAICLGLLAGRPLPVAAGAVMLAIGNALWVIGLWGGDELLLSSFLTHIGVFGLALAGARRLGVPRTAGLAGWIAMLGATGLARLAGPAAENINLSHHVPRGFEAIYPSHAVFLLVHTGLFAVAALALGAGLRAACGRLEEVRP